MIATGLILWTKKREFKSRNTLAFRVVNSLNIGTILGLPAAIGVYFLTKEADALFVTWALLILFAFFQNSNKAWYMETYFAALVYLLVPAFSQIVYSTGFNFIYFDIFFLGLALVLFFIAYKMQRRFLLCS